MPGTEQRVLVVDDEALARKSVVRQVRRLLPDAVVREARDGFEALELARDFSPTLVFLDVEMPELSGLDVVRQLAAPRPKIVFVTAFEHFAVTAFDENACDYVVKPFTEARFETALERGLAELDAEEKLLALERSLASSGRHLTRLALRLGSRVDVVAIESVACFVSKGHYTYVYAGDREYITELTLVHLEERLDPTAFTRVHRNALVADACIVRLIEGTASEVELNNGMRVPVSRRNRGALLKRLA